MAFGVDPCAFPVTPQGDVAEIESVPPRVECGAIQSENSIARHVAWWRNELGKSIVDRGAAGGVYARQQVPERESVTLSGFRQEDPQRGRIGGSIFAGGVKLREG